MSWREGPEWLKKNRLSRRLGAWDTWRFYAWREYPALLRRSRKVQAATLGTVLFFGAIGYGTYHYYPVWRAQRALTVAARLADASDLTSARLASVRAVQLNPGNAEAWHWLAYVAERGNDPMALAFWQRASALAPADTPLRLGCVRAALVVGNLDLAAATLQGVPAEVATESAQYQLYAGELARQRGQPDEAEAAFARSVQLRPGAPEGEVALGTMLVSATDDKLRERGVGYLEKWHHDAPWGLTALRALLPAAVADKASGRAYELAMELRAHPQHTPGDWVLALDALSLAAPARLDEVVRESKIQTANDGAAAAVLVGWFCRQGRADEALAWVGGLDVRLTQVPPLATAIADTQRIRQDWPALARWTSAGDWDDAEILRLAYVVLAARRQNDGDAGERAWAALRRSLSDQPARANFLANLIYGWGLESESVALWKSITDDPQWGLSAGGALARHYQVLRDAAGQAQAFSRLYELAGRDPRIANNFAYMAVLADYQSARGVTIAEENHRRFPQESAYAATWAFALWRAGRVGEALAVVEPLLPLAQNNPGLAYTCGLVLAGAGRYEEARDLLGRVNLSSLTLAEETLARQALAGH